MAYTEFRFNFDPRYRPDKEAEIVIEDNCALLPVDYYHVHQVLLPDSGIPIDGKLVYAISDGKIYFATVNALTNHRIIFPKKLIVAYISIERHMEIEKENREWKNLGYDVGARPPADLFK